MDDHIPVLREQARALPELPGVYFWHDNRDRILYIGKAVNLRARVTSYFSHARRDRRTRQLLSCSRSIHHEVAGSELEALLRESALIKRHQPPFNRALRTSRPLFYLRLSTDDQDPYLEIVRSDGEDDSLVFGPFHSGHVARETLAFLHDVLPLRKCTARRPRCRSCLYYQMHTCAGPLIDEEHRRRHQEAIDHLHQLLDGRADRLESWLEGKRDRASDAMLFERAAEVQERLCTLRTLNQRQIVLETAARCRHLLIRDEAEEVRLLLVARGRVLAVRDQGQLGVADVVQWVCMHRPIARTIKQEQSDLDAASVLEKWLRGRREHVRWVAVPPDLDDRELRDRVAYVLGRVPAAV